MISIPPGNWELLGGHRARFGGFRSVMQPRSSLGPQSTVSIPFAFGCSHQNILGNDIVYLSPAIAVSPLAAIFLSARKNAPGLLRAARGGYFPRRSSFEIRRKATQSTRLYNCVCRLYVVSTFDAPSAFSRGHFRELHFDFCEALRRLNFCGFRGFAGCRDCVLARETGAELATF